MKEVEQHEMHLEATYPSGAEQWLCPTCRRQFVMRWPPAYSMTIIDPGDEYARHSGSKGSLRIGPTQVMEAEETPLTDELLSPPIYRSYEAEEPEETPITDELRPWLKWMQDAGLYDDGHDGA